MKIKTEPVNVSNFDKSQLTEIWEAGCRVYVDSQAEIDWFNFYGRKDALFFNSPKNRLIGDQP